MGFVKVHDEQVDCWLTGKVIKISAELNRGFLRRVYLCGDVSTISCNWLEVMFRVHLHRIWKLANGLAGEKWPGGPERGCPFLVYIVLLQRS